MDESARQAALADLYTQPGHLLWRAAARVAREVDTALPAGIDLHAYAVLLALADREPQSQRSLAALIGVSGTTLTSVAATLQRDGLVERVRNPDDRRSYALTRTTAGRAAARRWRPHVARLERTLTGTFVAGEAQRLRTVLARVAADTVHADTPHELLDSTGFLVTKAHQRAHRVFADLLDEVGIEPRHFGVLRSLRLLGPTPQGQLGDLFEVSPATVVQMVDDLEARGLVARRRDEADRRAYRLVLQPAADQVLERVAALKAPARLGIDASERRDLVRLLRRLLGV